MVRESIMTYFFYSGFRVQWVQWVQWVQRGAVRRIQTGKRRECLWGDARRSLDSRFPSYRQPSPMGKVKRRRLRRKKGSQPRLAALSSPFQGKGLAWMLPPSFGRRCPEGAEVGGGKRYPRHTAFPSRGRCPEGADRVLAV